MPDAVNIVGLTGGIASGKSAIARTFGTLGIPSLDADQVAREIVEPGSPALEEIRDLFGEAVLQRDGSLDRALVAELVYRDPLMRRRLETITHPRILARSQEKLRALQSSGAPYVIYDASLLVETGRYREFVALIVASCRAATQIQRLKDREGLDETRARQRLAAQLPLEEKLAVADYVISTEGAKEDLLPQVERVHRALCARFGLSSDRGKA